MSIRVMTVVWEVQFPTQSQKLIALKMADYASDNGNSIFPSNESLAKRSGCDERTVQRTLKAFRDCGIIHLIKQGGNGPKDTNEWWLNVPLLKQIADGEATMTGSGTALEINTAEAVENMGDSVSPLEGLRVTSDALRVTPVTPKGDASVTQSVNNHQLESSKRKVSNFDLKSEVKPPAKAVPCFTITPADTSWEAWLTHFRESSNRSLAYDASQKKRIRVSTRWPTPESIVFEPQVTRPVKDFTSSEDAA
jgi:hypothetical protein